MDVAGTTADGRVEGAWTQRLVADPPMAGWDPALMLDEAAAAPLVGEVGAGMSPVYFVASIRDPLSGWVQAYEEVATEESLIQSSVTLMTF